MGFFRQEYWSGWPFPNPGIELESPASLALAGGVFITAPRGKLSELLGPVTCSPRSQFPHLYKEEDTINSVCI